MTWSAISALKYGSIGNTLALILIIIVVRFLIVRMIKGRTDKLSDIRRRWLSIVQNSSIMLGILGLVFIWSPQLSTFALSLTAFAVALVVATKEYLLCIVGALYRATSSPFAIGDWIEVQGMRGEVITEGFLTTKLQELGTSGSRFDFTGRVLTVPNSVLLTQTVFNESHRNKYLHHRFVVTVEPNLDPAPILIKALKKLSDIFPKNEVERQQHWTMLSHKYQTELPPHDPQISVETTNLGKIAFTVLIFCSMQNAVKAEAEVTVLILTQVANAKDIHTKAAKA